MTESKPWYVSRTIWAAVVTVAASVLGLLGRPLDGLDQAAAVEAILQAVTAVAGVVALVGRLAAKTSIRGKTPPADPA